MKPTPSLLEFLESSGASVRVYDAGRRVTKIPRGEFLRFEQTRIPYPQPLQSQAWFALSQSYPGETDEQEPLVWFLRLPLDEQGKLVLASRDYFLHRLLEGALAGREEGAAGSGVADAFKDNPYTFKPREDRMAVVHAKLSRDLKRPPSRFYAHARDYFQGKPGWDQWSFVGYQGIADMAVRVADPRTEAVLSAAIPRLPAEPLTALCHCLENEPLPINLSNALLERLSDELTREQPSISCVGALVRGLSQTVSRNVGLQMFDQLMNHTLRNQVEILVAISGRAWELIRSAEQMARFLESLAENGEGQAVFNECVADLLRLPGFRDPVLEAVRNPARSDRLAACFQRMTQHLSGEAPAQN